jgi:flagellar M-ring protein FliF
LGALKRLAEPVARVWREAGATQRLAILTFIILALGVVAVAAVVASRTSYGVLYSNLQEDDAGSIVAKLKEQKVSYRLAGGGTVVEVPENQVHELRLSLASAGLPRGGNVGFEIFDRSQLGLSEFGEKLNYQRALQGELARTICQLDPVQYARVHIVMPRERLYSANQERASASVVVRLRPGTHLTSDQVRSITNLVSSAIEGLEPQLVTVVDTAGTLLSADPALGGEGGGTTVAAARLALRREYEHEVERNVQTMLDRVLGPGKAVVRANAVINFDKKETEQEQFEPLGKGTGVLESQQEKTETYNGGVPLPSGVPGTASNIALAPATVRSDHDNYQRKETTAQYRVSRKIERTTVEPGQVERLSVAVFVDGDVGSAQKAALENAVATAAGIDLQRGDRVTIEVLPFDTTAAAKQEKEGKSLERRDLLVSIGKNAAAIALLVVFLLMTRSFFKVKPAGDEEPVIAAEIPETRPIGAYASQSLQQQQQPQALPDLAGADPAGLAKIVRGLIREE